MREPEPTPADQWSTWEMEPTIPNSWPGLDLDRPEGFEISRGPVRSVGGKLVALAAAAGDFNVSGADDIGVSQMRWDLPRELHRMMAEADRAVAGFWNDVYAEAGMAGMLIERAAANYKLADHPLLGDVPIEQLQERVNGLGNGMLRGPSDIYPNGIVPLTLSTAINYGVDDMTAEQAKRDIEILVMNGGHRDPQSYAQMAESLVDLAHMLRLRAQDLRDSPWRGEAAVKAQWALRQTYGSVTALAAVNGALTRASSRFLEVITWCAQNFEAMADPDRSGWDEFWDFGGTADSRARDFLAQANKAFMEVYELMPKRIEENLPGLLVNDQNHLELKWRVKDIHESKLRMPRSNWDDPWLQLLERREDAYGEAEEYYG
ncbi:hypothetical protein AB0K12_43880 [Nonomuraea sp. NPDC049419]|uniref:hypothetical protein n=1 Tax=Nonomuraea sp. NPDC049419 TaxID=3155772 RepID=UPI00344837DC